MYPSLKTEKYLEQILILILIYNDHRMRFLSYQKLEVNIFHSNKY